MTSIKNKIQEIAYYLNPIGYKNDIEKEIEKRNRADTYNMTTEPEMEAYRHILTSILFSKKYGPIMAEAFGNANESKDLLLRKGLDNTIIDLRNNEIGRNYYKKHPNLPDNDYYDMVFNDFIAPKRVNMKNVYGKVIDNLNK